MSRARRLAFAVCSVAAVAGRALAASRDEVAKAYAPVIYQETNDPLKDLLTAFDFDGDWNGDNQAEDMLCWGGSACLNMGCNGQKCPLTATVYYTVIETESHWFVQYMPYHPLDWKLLTGHENDTESIFAVVAKSGGDLGTLEAVEVRFHNSWYQYRADAAVMNGADNIDGPVHYDQTTGHPAVYSQMVGHGLCGGFSPPNRLAPELSLTCDHNGAPHIDQTGVVYRPDLPATMPLVVDKQTVMAGYQMVELQTSVWTHIHEIGPGMAFQTAIDFKGERCNLLSCPTQFGGNWESDGKNGNDPSPGEPWAQEGGNGVSAVGDQFFNPAYTMSKRLAFPMPFSVDYCWNPYVGITTGCASDLLDAGVVPLDGALAPGGDGASASDGNGLGSDGSNLAMMTPGGCGCTLGAPLVAVRYRFFFVILLAGMLLLLRRSRA